MELVSSLQTLAPAAILANSLIILIGVGLVWTWIATFSLRRKGRQP